MSQKKLDINSVICDVRKVAANTLAAYKSIKINTGMLFNNESSSALMADYDVDINAENVVSLPDDETVAHKVINGTCLITKGMFTTPTYLLVNGKAEIEADAFDGENQLLGITVNGTISYPDSLSGSLPPMTVNGKAEVYPADCTKLPDTANVDKLFILRSKATRYYSRKRVLMLDLSADILRLAEKNTMFVTKEAYIASSLLEDAVNLFDESIKITEVPDGTVYLPDCDAITGDTLRRHGGKLLILDDVRITGLSAEELQMLESLHVAGSIYTDEAGAARLHTLSISPDTEIFILRGDLIMNRGSFLLTAAQLERSDALTVFYCGSVTIDNRISPEEIRDKLSLLSCGTVLCTTNQLDAVELAATDCGQIVCSDSAPEDTEHAEDEDTTFINTVKYQF